MVDFQITFAYSILFRDFSEGRDDVFVGTQSSRKLLRVLTNANTLSPTVVAENLKKKPRQFSGIFGKSV